MNYREFAHAHYHEKKQREHWEKIKEDEEARVYLKMRKERSEIEEQRRFNESCPYYILPTPLPKRSKAFKELAFPPNLETILKDYPPIPKQKKQKIKLGRTDNQWEWGRQPIRDDQEPIWENLQEI